ncbi:ABC-2 type transport system ATP-binding protein [Natranaerovirga hydrolytica]|uniref:ABC-2 type transport system ATP-binding protein n=1 Tax=Natranaerovirga hydrolytica TaxID=680378 RepID=A0A4R1N6I5_9FIRM|nr:ATP-binding cassette domain-containing protein [Natranaerovirga hydrolytica]TCK98243.1 ABC-2 type transport system ATP-binding protein [Natranaerovirga hydrolytica]
MSLQLINVRKSYGKNQVLNGIDIKLTNGIYGFLGANGVGKTTLFKIISGFITDYQGKIILPDVNEKKEVVLGFLPQSFTGYPDMTIQQFLLYLGSIKSNMSKDKLNKDIDEKLDLFNLEELRHKKLKELSGGQIRRVGLAQAFQLNPKIIMLDEPTTGLDPTERIKFKNYITGAGHDQIILLSTHIVSDLESISKEIFILKDGHFVMSGTEKDLIGECSGQVWEAEFKNELDLHNQMTDQTVSMIYDSEEKKKARIISSVPPFPEAIQVTPTLNDVYLVNFKKEERSSVR